MKKSLIALAAIAASGLAMAQSSVTLYGVADIAVGDAGDVQGAHSNSNINNANSRIGFRGVEDLGNGLKASFQLEQAVRLADGNTGGNGGNGNGTTFARQAWVGLSGDFGAIRAGRQLTPSFDGIGAWELTGTANYSAVGLVFGYSGGSRDNALVKYISPSFGGLKLTAGYIFEDNYDALGPYADTKGKYDISVVYANGPITAAATYNNSEVNTGANSRSNVENASLGGSYDFGSFKLAASYHYNEGVTAGAPYTSNGLEGYSLGATLPLGAFSLTADAVYAEQRNGPLDGVDVVVEAKYALSKRTFVYGVYYYADKKGPTFNSTFSEENNFALGLRHNF